MKAAKLPPLPILMLSSVAFVMIITSLNFNRVSHKSTNQNVLTQVIEPTTHPTPEPTSKPSPKFSTTLPDSWSISEGGSTLRSGLCGEDNRPCKIGGVPVPNRYYETCSDYYESLEGVMHKVINEWTEVINKVKWQVQHFEVPCLGGCIWHSYCTETQGGVVHFYISREYALEHPTILREYLASFSFQ